MEPKEGKQNKEEIVEDQRISSHEISFLGMVTGPENNSKNVLRRMLSLKDNTNLSILIMIYMRKIIVQKHFPFS